MLFAAVLVGGVAIAVRSSGDDDDDAEDIAGPAAELPAVVEAADDLAASSPDPIELGSQYGEITAAYATLTDDVEFSEQFDRLPDAEAELLGRSLGAIQGQLSPTAIGGARTDDDRAADIVYALGMARGMVQSLDPDASPRDQALAVLPFSVQDLVGFDALAEQFATGDLNALAAAIDTEESGESGATGALTDAGAAELISSIAFLIGQRLPTGDTAGGDYATLFTDAYNAALPPRSHERPGAHCAAVPSMRPRRRWSRSHVRDPAAGASTQWARVRSSVGVQVVGGRGQPGEAAGLAAQHGAPELVGLAR